MIITPEGIASVSITRQRLLCTKFIEGVNYKFDYPKMIEYLKKGKLPFAHEMAYYKKFILNDLWFIMYFVMEMDNVNHPFVINACREVEQGPVSMTLDLWARFHMKTSLITHAETIQYVLKFPEKTTLILSHTKAASERLMFTIKEILASNELLRACFPDIIYSNADQDSPVWSLDKGCIVKRSTKRKEPTVANCGLIEGMATSGHYNRMVYDDIITEDVKDSISLMEKIKEKFDSSQNLCAGEDSDIQRVIGTTYHYDDPLIYIKNKKSITGEPLYTTRIKTATIDGTRNGKPVFISQAKLDQLKTTRTFNAQQLLDPTPSDARVLDKTKIKLTTASDMPERLYKFMLVDPAGSKGTGDACAIMVIGVNLNSKDIGASDIYILDMRIDKLPLTEFVTAVAEMYCRNGKILQVVIEKVGQSTAEIHVASKLKEDKGVRISVDNNTLVIVHPRGRHKVDRINNISWPLDNGRIHLSANISATYINRFYSEMDGFPNAKDDHAIDMLSYFILDVLPLYKFPRDYHNVVIAQEIPMLVFN